jgi:hypothetical protein
LSGQTPVIKNRSTRNAKNSKILLLLEINGVFAQTLVIKHAKDEKRQPKPTHQNSDLQRYLVNQPEGKIKKKKVLSTLFQH